MFTSCSTCCCCCKIKDATVWGVSAEFLARFAQKHDLQSTSPNLFPKDYHPDPPHWWNNDGTSMTKSTGNVTSAIIVPMTKHAGVTYVDLDGVREMKEVNVNTTEKFISDVGVATIFVSHSWGCSFSRLIETLITHSQKERKNRPNEPPPYYWLDIFSKNQHIVQGDDTAKELTRAVQETGITLLMCDGVDNIGNWYTPKCFTRVWCLYEIMWTLRLDSQLIVILPEMQVLSSLSDVDQDSTKGNTKDPVDEIERIDFQVLNAISNINVLNSEASVIEDRQRILDSINETVGCETMSHEIAVVLVDAMAESLLEIVLSKQSFDLQTNNKNDDNKGDIQLIENNKTSSTKIDNATTNTTCTNSTVIDYQKILTTLRLSWRASELLLALGWTQPASDILSNAIKECNVIKILQLEHAAKPTPTTIDDIFAKILEQDTKTILLQTKEYRIRFLYIRELLSFANHTYLLQLATRRQELIIAKDSSPDLVSTIMIKLQQIVSAFRSILQMRIVLLGKSHRESMGTCNNLGNALISIDQFDEAYIYHEEAYTNRIEKYGQDHIDVLQSLNNIGSLHDARGILFYQQCCDNWNYDENAANTNAKSLLNSANSEWKKGVDIFKQVASRREVLLGPFHMETIYALINAANNLEKQVDENDVYYNYDESIIYYNKALIRLQQRYGYTNPHTLDCANSIATTMDTQGNDTIGAIDLLENMLSHIDLSGGQQNDLNSACKAKKKDVYYLKRQISIKNVKKIQNKLELLKQKISPGVVAVSVAVKVESEY